MARQKSNYNCNRRKKNRPLEHIIVASKKRRAAEKYFNCIKNCTNCEYVVGCPRSGSYLIY